MAVSNVALWNIKLKWRWNNGQTSSFFRKDNQESILIVDSIVFKLGCVIKLRTNVGIIKEDRGSLKRADYVVKHIGMAMLVASYFLRKKRIIYPIFLGL
uniref:Transposase n=1 Tax=Steinernema glaseri TaxID=37863 RepID=A0A1I8AH60_9BILA